MRRAALVLLLLGACGSDAGPPDARVIDAKPPGGTFSLTWTMHDGATSLACGDISASVVSVTILPDSAASGVVDTFSCTSLTGTTRALDAGKYTITVELDGGTGALAPTQQFLHVEVMSGQDTALGNVDFPIVATGGISTKVAAQAQTSNCGTGTGEAGIDAMTLELQDAGGACIPATFTVAAGAGTSAGTYTSACPAAAAAPCLEKDQLITVTGLKSGPVRFLVGADVGGKDCWPGSSSLTVPTMNQVKDYGTAILIRDTTLCPTM